MSDPQKELDEAVEKFVRDSGWHEAGVLTGWILIGHQAGFDDDGEPTSAYPVIYMGGNLPPHVSAGLLSVGQDILDGSPTWSRRDIDE